MFPYHDYLANQSYVLMSATGGYMVGWILSGFAMWLLEKLLGVKIWVQAISMLIGLVICYILGTAWFMVVYTQHTGQIGLRSAVMWCVIPFVLPDIVKLGLALFLSERLKRMVKKT